MQVIYVCWATCLTTVHRQIADSQVKERFAPSATPLAHRGVVVPSSVVSRSWLVPSRANVRGSALGSSALGSGRRLARSSQRSGPALQLALSPVLRGLAAGVGGGPSEPLCLRKYYYNLFSHGPLLWYRGLFSQFFLIP